MRFVYRYIDGKQDIPDRFHYHYIGQRFYMIKIEVFSGEEYTDYLEHHPRQNLILISTSIDHVALHAHVDI